VYLEEIELDLPYVIDTDRTNKIIKDKLCTPDEAIKVDYEQNWKQKRRKFSLETRCMTALFERLLGKFQADNCKKILIECVDYAIENKILNFSGVYTVQVKFDYKSFSCSSKEEKKIKALNAIWEGINKVSKQNEWEMTSFKAVYSKICDINYVNEWVWKKTKNAEKDLSAEVFMQHEIDWMNISILIKDKFGKEIFLEKIISELPDEYAYSKHLGKLKWTSNRSVSLVNKKNDKEWKVKVRSMSQ